MAILSTLALALAAAGSVNAHGYLKYVDVGGVTYGAWDVFSDPYITPRPFRYNRRYADNGPVVGMTTNNITCNNGPNSGSGVGIITVAAGSTIKLVWDQWGSSHSGPVMNYMARCTPDCASFSGSSGSPWFKIDQMGYDPTKSPPWGSDYLAKLGAWWKVTIPPTIQAGEYLLRHEILGLHVAGTVDGAQFYPSCVHLRVTGGGSDTPSGVSLPGAYQPRDPGILAELWRINQGQVTYTAPGGPVWSKAAPGPQSAATAVQQNYTPVTHAPSTSGGSNPTTTPATTTPRTTTTTSRVTSTPVSQTTTTTSRTTTTTSRTTTTGGSGTGAALWQQCGGSGHSGPTTCASGTCVVLNPYYSQCQP